ncbi:MAG: DUF1289 domain-containing protein [Proteobacteria bacterium]|nr:DUF1289 domain-containing protein [Pseudomonadota bacterium]
MTVPSPCISICALDEHSGLCKGCYRTGDEIAHWLYYSDDEKRQVLARLEQRRHPRPETRPGQA